MPYDIWPITAASALGEEGLRETDQSQQRVLTERRGLETDSSNCFTRVVYE